MDLYENNQNYHIAFMVLWYFRPQSGKYKLPPTEKLAQEFCRNLEYPVYSESQLTHLLCEYVDNVLFDGKYELPEEILHIVDSSIRQYTERKKNKPYSIFDLFH